MGKRLTTTGKTSEEQRQYFKALLDDPEAPVPMSVRLKAWWQGYDIDTWLAHQLAQPRSRSTATSAVTDQVGPEAAQTERPVWSAARIEVVEQIWGQGFATPGGEDFIPNLIKLLGLNPAMSVLDLSAGLGGAARLMVQKYGAWVTGLEMNEVLATAGMERSMKAGMAKRAPITVYNPEFFELEKRYDCIFSKESFYTVANKERLFALLVKGLKPNGQLLFSDYVIDEDRVKPAALAAWTKREAVTPHLWTLARYQQMFKEHELDMRTTVDITDDHRLLVLTAWSRFSEMLKEKNADRETLLEMFREAELWARRMVVLENGVRVYRFFGLRPGGAIV